MPTPGERFDQLVEIMRRLRAPDGCPWDREQTLQSLRPFLLEETYEALEAIDRNDPQGLCEELGDLLFEVVFLARVSEEAGQFSVADAVDTVATKLIRRHPHVFGDRHGLNTDQVNVQWDEIKAEEKAARAKAGRTPAPGRDGALGGVSAGLPALTRALKLQQKASKVGFDWNDSKAVIAKIREETDEIEAALGTRDRAEILGEVGDLLFVVVNLARHLEVDPEAALRTCNLKVERRFAAIEEALAAVGKTPAEATLAEMDALWDQAKAREKA